MEGAMAAAKKKPKAKVKRKKTPAGKPAIRKKPKLLKKAAAKKPAKRAAPKPFARPASKARAVPARPAPKSAPVAPARPEPLPGEELIGVVTHYYGHLSVAAIRLESGGLSVGDTIRVLGHTSDFRQRIVSMQIEHQPVTEAGKRQEIGLKVTEHARENDLVYKVTA
jgi:putative protease